MNEPDAMTCALQLRMSLSGLGRPLRAAAGPDGLSIAKLGVLAWLHRLGPLTPTELASREAVKLQSLTRLLSELEAEGWVSRASHPNDRRQSVLSLTRLGARQLAAQARAREAALAHAIEATLTAQERALLLRACGLLDRLADSLTGAGAPAIRAAGRPAVPT